MKTKVRTQTVDDITYICETCGEESHWIGTIEQCEKQHACDHVYIYEWLFKETEYTDYVVGVKKTCEICRKVFKEVDLENVDEVATKELFDVMTKYEEV